MRSISSTTLRHGHASTERPGTIPKMVDRDRRVPATGHPFYQRLNHVLDRHRLDEFVEPQCASFYAREAGASESEARHVIPPAADRILCGRVGARPCVARGRFA